MKIPMIPDKGVREATEKVVGGGGGGQKYCFYVRAV